MSSNHELVEFLRSRAWLKTLSLIKVFEKTDRAKFIPPAYAEHAYLDTPLPTLAGQTISAPSVVAVMTEALQPKAGQKILEVGSGSGYQAAVIAEAIGAKGRLYTVESVPALFDYARKKLAAYKSVEVVYGDGSLGLPEKAPFDGIIVTAGAPAVPKALFDQLKEDCRLVIPVGQRYFQDLLLVRKVDGKPVTESLLPVAFVPLVGKQGFKP
ncbi:protein-L-isoaspartate(D-aspartate) O-methyltransferase [Candidatus Micrarchaeota archaeon]|nr:protein-L-isoaspartate(D-aspartate) O-methyltransferase [Candidatus Micrarchaeota archaeon]